MEKQSKTREYIQSIVIAVLLALFIRAFIVQAFKIPSGSMEPTLLVGDHLLVNKFIYGVRIPFTNTHYLSLHKPKRGDVIVFIFPLDTSKDFIKRVIGEGGEKVQIIEDAVYINDHKINDPWGYFSNIGPPALLKRIRNFGPVIVPENSLFVLGDNRDNSEDSRFWGFLPFQNVLGKAFIIYFSWNSPATDLWHKIRWSTFGKLIHEHGHECWAGIIRISL